MASSKHIIKRQVIEVDVPSVEAAWKIQNRFSELYKYELMHILDEVFSNFSGPDEVLRIDKLEIDLGKISMNASDDEVVTKLRTVLQEKISEIKQKTIQEEVLISPEETVKNARNIRYTNADFLVHFLKTGTAPWWYNKQSSGTVNAIVGEMISSRPQWVKVQLKPLLAVKEIRSRLVSHLDDKRMIEFLNVLSPEVIRYAERVKILIADQIPEIRSGSELNVVNFRPLFWNSVMERIVTGKRDLLIALFSGNELMKIVQSLVKKERVMREFLQILELPEIISADEKGTHRGKKGLQKGMRKSPVEKNDSYDEFTNENLTDIEAGIKNEGRIAENNNPELTHESDADSENTLREKKTGIKKSGKSEGRNKLIKRGNKNKFNKGDDKSEMASDIPDESAEQFSNETSNQIRKIHAQNDQETQELFSANTKGELTREESAKKFETDEELETYSINDEDLADFTIQNAGLVLLWPYLNPFFAELGLVADKKFIDEAASSRAVHLLHYLTTGVESGYEEHELVLNKLLCGLEVDAAIEMEFEITAKEKEESENLLQAVINNWKAIGSTSVNGLRGTFILREGALKKDEQGWRLFVDRKAYDVLLDRLPWGISIIRLPWNTEMMYVEW
jgi:hypothetical protein